ncbi:MAG: radical SAM protein [candidate division WOR-3 bacterium]
MYRIIETIEKEYESCHICPRNCGVNRLKGKRGFCGVDRNSKVFNTAVLVNEIEEIAPTYAIYFAGCNLRCIFCSVAEENTLISTGKEKTQMGRDFVEVNDRFIEKIETEIEKLKPKTISFIGGEPSVHLLTIFELIEKLRPKIPLVFYTNLYYNPRINQILSEWFEFIVADMHFGNNTCTRMSTETNNMRICADYFETTTANIKATRNKVILRHLLLPGHLDCCFKKIIDWMSVDIPYKSLWLLTNYFPYLNTQIDTDKKEDADGHRLDRRIAAASKGLARMVSADEIAKALDYAKNKGIIIKILDLFKLRREMSHCLADNQEIVINEDGIVAFKYLDGMAVEMARQMEEHNTPHPSLAHKGRGL